MKKWLFLLFTLFFCTLSSADELVVITHPNNGVEKLEREELIDLYMGRSKKLPSGIVALPIDWPANSEEKKKFNQQLVHKSVSEIQAYWAKLLFTGQATPPIQMENKAEILDVILHNQGAIAYIYRSQINSSVKIVYEFQE